MADLAELLAELLADLAAEMADAHRMLDGLRSRHGDAVLAWPTPAEGWTVHDTVGHLAFFDGRARTALHDPAGFTAEAAALAADPAGFMARAVAQQRALGADALLTGWRETGAALLADLRALAAHDPAARLPWYGPPMGLASFATARLMEYWAHGQDVADAAGLRRPATRRLRHVADLGVRTRRFSFANRGLAPPEAEVRVELTGPDGERWSWGDPQAAESIRGDAAEFALLVTQRRHLDDLSLVVVGAGARAWAGLAQAFAGPPGPGRAPAATSAGSGQG